VRPDQSSFQRAEDSLAQDKRFGTTVRGLVAGDRIEIRGFGVFSIREYDGYTARNPKTGEEIGVSAKGLPFFKCGKDCRDQVNKR
jgi:integration host factor subunit beta